MSPSLPSSGQVKGSLTGKVVSWLQGLPDGQRSKVVLSFRLLSMRCRVGATTRAGTSVDPKLRKRCDECGFLAVVRLQWITRGGVAELPCPSCGVRMRVNAWSGLYERHQPQGLTDDELEAERANDPLYLRDLRGLS
jgi:predicted RNA-binding Zn-ribbon protein involved in translation (DUF1610 family)